MIRNLKFWLALLAILVGSNSAGWRSQAFAITSYHIGNSLTWDAAPKSYDDFAAQRGLSHSTGYHIRSATGLHTFLASPDVVSEPAPAPYGKFNNALPNYAWDAVTLQPHPAQEATLGSDVSSILSFIDLTRSNPANADTRFYVYSTWPMFGNYRASWDAPVADDLQTTSQRSRQYFEHVLNRVRAQTDATVLMVPVGDVLYELDLRLSSGLVPGYSNVLPFYRDSQHMSPALGRYAAALTMYATITGEYPTGLTKPDDPSSFSSTVPTNAAAIYAAINDAVQDVVGSHAYSGVQFFDPPRADFDDSGLVDAADLAILQQAMGKSAVADADLDGDVDSADRLVWQSQLGLTSRKTSNFDATDVDRDGVTGATDLGRWRQSVGLNAGYDPDGDGDSDGQDVLRWQRNLTTTFAGDFNRDYVVNASDETLWAANNGFNIRADANGDGVVNQGDYAIWQEEEGRMWPPPPNYPDIAAVPEPASAILAPMALLAARLLASTRRRRRG